MTLPHGEQNASGIPLPENVEANWKKVKNCGALYQSLPHFLLLCGGFSYKWRKILGMLSKLKKLRELTGAQVKNWETLYQHFPASTAETATRDDPVRSATNAYWFGKFTHDTMKNSVSGKHRLT